MENGRNRQSDPLGINRISRNIRKSPPPLPNPRLHPHQIQQLDQNPQNLHQNQLQNQNPQPQVYNISKNDFRSVVQHLTGTPTREPVPAAPPRPKTPSMRLQKIRPPPLSPVPPPSRGLYPRQLAPMPPFPAPLPPPAPPQTAFWRAGLESPTTAYMKYLESSIINADGGAPAGAAGGLLPSPAAPPASSGLLPSPTAFANLSPFPVLSPKFQFPPLSPGFQFSPLPGQGGILGPAPPGSPLFPLSPSAFLLSPRWRDL
ncbi:protein HAIKU1-like [Wolffia australiana]